MADCIESLRPYVKALIRIQEEVHKDRHACAGSITQLALAIAIGHALGDDPHFKLAAREDVARALQHVRDKAAGILPLDEG